MTRIKLSWSFNDEDVLDAIHEHLSKTSGVLAEEAQKSINNALSALFDRDSEDAAIRGAHAEFGDALQNLQELYMLIEEADTQMMAYQSYKSGAVVPVPQEKGGGVEVKEVSLTGEDGTKTK